jgi:hypothetical protein
MERILEAKVKNIEYLGKILIQQEKEFVVSHKMQGKIYKKLGIENKVKKENNYELESLLNESSSDDGGNSEGSEDEEEAPGDFDASDILIDLECEESTGKKLMMMEEEEKVSGEVQQFQERMKSRTAQIGNVTNSIGRIQDMFTSLNEIVLQQG